MTWWMWIGFWILFWIAAFVYLAWRTWRLWPHAREFGRTASAVLDQVETVRQEASGVRSAAPRPAAPANATELVTAAQKAPIAWDTPAAEWRRRWREQRRQQREKRLDQHARTWATWGRRVD